MSDLSLESADSLLKLVPASYEEQCKTLVDGRKVRDGALENGHRNLAPGRFQAGRGLRRPDGRRDLRHAQLRLQGRYVPHPEARLPLRVAAEPGGPLSQPR